MTEAYPPAVEKSTLAKWVNQVYGWACDRLYDEFAWSYDFVSWCVSLGRWQAWRNSVWPYIQGKAVLELGSGPGHLLVDGCARGYRMVGIDLSSAMIRLGRRRLRAAAMGEIVQADGCRLPFADASFDTVVATFPAGYVLSAAALNECCRVLTAQGRIVLWGLWVSGGPQWAQIVPAFYGAPDGTLVATIVARCRTAGFHAQVVEHADGNFCIGGMIADKDSPCPCPKLTLC
jgi:SAM-dependent methyltransferase